MKFWSLILTIFIILARKNMGLLNAMEQILQTEIHLYKNYHTEEAFIHHSAIATFLQVIAKPYCDENRK